MKRFLEKYSDLLLFGGFCLVCYFVYIFQLGSYPLLDADETRYADVARYMHDSKDYVTMFLDGKIFWDKPPLYFWVESLSISIFKTCNEFSVRLPSVMFAMSSAFGLYFIGKKLISRNFGLISALILITSVEYVIFAKVAILDMVLTTFIILSTLSGFVTYFVKDSRKKYWWWSFYICSALAVLSKGIPGLVIPFGTMFFVGLWKKNLKEFFNPQYILPGVVLFLLIALPWHIIMYHIHGMEFVREYIIKHHIMRFLGSPEIGREHTMIYYIPVFVVGFLPWTMSLIFSFFNVIGNKKRLEINHFILMNVIGLIFTFVFFSISKTKLITYILPVFPFAAVVTGYVWYNFVQRNLFRKSIRMSVYITNVAFLIVGVAILIMKFFLPQSLYADIKSVQLFLSTLFIVSGIYGLCALKNNKRLALFLSYVAVSLCLSAYFIPKLFNIWYKFGQNDLMVYANYARENNMKLAAFRLWERYSLQYYYSGNVLYYKFPSDSKMEYVRTTDLKNIGNYVMVVDHKNLDSLKYNNVYYKVLRSGKRYDLLYDDRFLQIKRPTK